MQTKHFNKTIWMNRFQAGKQVEVTEHDCESDAFDDLRANRGTYLSTIIYYANHGPEEHDLERDADEFNASWRSDFQEHNTRGM